MANKTKKGGIIESAVEAAEELGAAATAFKESWEHVKKARAKGAPATRAAARMGKSATKAVAKAGKGTVKAAKKMLPGKKRKK